MIEYEFGKWGIGFIFKSKGVMNRSIAFALPPTAVALIVGLLLREHNLGVSKSAAVLLPFLYGRHPDGSPNYEEQADFKGLLSLWGSFTFVLSFLLIFKTQIAYNRYWDGISNLEAMRSTWYNATSNLIAFTSADKEHARAVTRFQHLLVRIMSVLHCAALQDIAVMEDTKFPILGDEGIDKKSLNHLELSQSKVDVAMQWVQRMIVEATSEGVVDVSPPILSRVFQDLSNGIVMAHDAKKISDFPFPFPFAQQLTILLIGFTCTLPFVCAVIVYPPIAAAITFAVINSLWSIHYIAAEIEMPFGDDPNDLPLKEFQTVFNRKLTLLLHPLTQCTPSFSYDEATHKRLIPEQYWSFSPERRVSLISDAANQSNDEHSCRDTEDNIRSPTESWNASQRASTCWGDNDVSLSLHNHVTLLTSKGRLVLHDSSCKNIIGASTEHPSTAPSCEEAKLSEFKRKDLNGSALDNIKSNSNEVEVLRTPEDPEQLIDTSPAKSQSELPSDRREACASRVDMSI